MLFFTYPTLLSMRDPDTHTGDCKLAGRSAVSASMRCPWTWGLRALLMGLQTCHCSAEVRA